MRNQNVVRFAFVAPLRHEPYVAVPLPQGGEARLRPLRRGELEPQRAVFDGLSESSRTDRFLTGVDRLTASMWQALGNVDGHDHVAWLATVDDRPVGVGRFARVAPCTAEVAFEVVDDHQGLGLGTILLDTITTVAAAMRIRRLQASVLGSNLRSRHLLSRVGLDLQPSDGLLEGESLFHLLDRPRVDRPAVLRLAFEAEAEGREPLASCA
jgi:RimJ/RimL family protein N-acetyltransferase